MAKWILILTGFALFTGILGFGGFLTKFEDTVEVVYVSLLGGLSVILLIIFVRKVLPVIIKKINHQKSLIK